MNLCIRFGPRANQRMGNNKQAQLPLFPLSFVAFSMNKRRKPTGGACASTQKALLIPSWKHPLIAFFFPQQAVPYITSSIAHFSSLTCDFFSQNPREIGDKEV